MSGDERSGGRADVLVVGAGAAGLMAAIHAASAGARVVVAESTGDGGRKILISGGGRANVLPSDLDASRFVTDSSPNTLRKMLLSWPLAEQRRFFERELGVALALEKETGKWFPASNRARDVRDALVACARSRGVRFVFSTRIEVLVREGSDWIARGARDRELRAAATVLATGGLSVPKTGSDGHGLAIARKLGHEVHPTYAALTAVLDAGARHRDLAGVSLAASVRAACGQRRAEASGGFLFTHRGYSGPAVLDVSHVAVRSEGSEPARLVVAWTPLDRDEWENELRPRRGGVAGVLRSRLPARLAQTLMDAAGVAADTGLSELRAGQRRRLIESLTRYELAWTGTEGYRSAEVTGGGVALAELEPRSLASRRCEGLFLCGEMLDAFGPIGGFNFAWAWATGRAAGSGAAAFASAAGSR